METENEHDYDATIDTFDHPRYELIGTGDVYDGRRAVERYFEETRTAFPDQRNELIALHHADDAVIVEAMLYGTHEGSFRGLPPTGRSFEMRFTRLLRLRGGPARLRARLLRLGTILRQLGIAHDPLTLTGRVATVLNHPVTVGRAVAAPGHRPLASVVRPSSWTVQCGLWATSNGWPSGSTKTPESAAPEGLGTGWGVDIVGAGGLRPR